MTKIITWCELRYLTLAELEALFRTLQIERGMITYSAIAGSWPNTLQMVTPFGTAPVSRRSRPAATDCSRRRRGAGGNPARQIWPTTISASSRIEVCSGVLTLARIRGATPAAKWPRNELRVFASLADAKARLD